MKSDFRESLEERFAGGYYQIHTNDFRYLLSKKGMADCHDLEGKL